MIRRFPETYSVAPTGGQCGMSPRFRAATPAWPPPPSGPTAGSGSRPPSGRADPADPFATTGAAAVPIRPRRPPRFRGPTARRGRGGFGAPLRVPRGDGERAGRPRRDRRGEAGDGEVGGSLRRGQVKQADAGGGGQEEKAAVVADGLVDVRHRERQLVEVGHRRHPGTLPASALPADRERGVASASCRGRAARSCRSRCP